MARRSARVGNVATISISNISDQLQGDPLEAPLRALYVNLRRLAFPSDPYNDDGYLWRIYNYRHQVTHRGANPFTIRLFLGDAGLSRAHLPPLPNRSIHFFLDPLNPARGASRATIADDIQRMVDVVRTRLAAAMSAVRLHHLVNGAARLEGN